MPRGVPGSAKRCGLGRLYTDGCRCDECRADSTRRTTQYRRRLAEARHGVEHPQDVVDPERAVKAIWDANAVRGISFTEMARVTGLDRKTITDIYHQRRTWITRQTQDVILKCYGPRVYVRREILDTNLVDASKYTWKVHCLNAQGWRLTDLREMLEGAGMSGGFLQNFRRGIQITLSTAKQIDWLAETIGDKRGPSDYTAKRTQRRGFFPLIH